MLYCDCPFHFHSVIVQHRFALLNLENEKFGEYNTRMYFQTMYATGFKLYYHSPSEMIE